MPDFVSNNTRLDIKKQGMPSFSMDGVLCLSLSPSFRNLIASL
jgi:hypothetical protein